MNEILWRQTVEAYSVYHLVSLDLHQDAIHFVPNKHPVPSGRKVHKLWNRFKVAGCYQMCSHIYLTLAKINGDG